MKRKYLNSVKAIVLVSTIIQFFASTPDAVAEVKYSYSKYGDTVLYDGTKKDEAYDVAIYLSNPELKGKKIVGIEVPAALSDKVSDYKGWISSELRLADNPETGYKENVADIAEKEATVSNGMVTAIFDTPYIIGDDGIYVGYSFDVTQIDSSNEYDPAKFPIALSQGATPGALFLHTARVYKQWKDRSETFNATSEIRVLLDGDFKEADASISVGNPLSISYELDTIDIPVKVTNYGLNPFSSLSFDCEIAGDVQQIDMNFDRPVEGYYGQSVQINLQIPQAYEVGEYPMSLKLKKINGIGNTNASGTANLELHILQLLPKKLPVVEEYTGLWCGWCPQGIVALSRLLNEYPDAITIAIHSGDTEPMAVTTEYPSKVNGFPSAYIDRKGGFQPKPTNILEIYEMFAAEYTPAALNVVMGRDGSDRKKINVVTTLEFVEAPANDCRLAYMLLANGLTDESWEQENYLSGKNDAYMEEFTSAGKTVKGLKYDHVLTMYSDYSGVAGSVPAKSDIRPYQQITHHYTFDTGDIDLSDPYKKKIVSLLEKAGDNLTVVALLVDQQTGTIVNAAKTKSNLSSVETVSDDETEGGEIRYYNMLGERISGDSKGLCVKVTVTPGGNIKSEKIIKR